MYHMNDITAAIALIQLRKLDALHECCRQLVARYNEVFADLDWLERPVEKPWARSACHNYVVKVPERDRFMKQLQELDIAPGVHYIPNHHYPRYAGLQADVPVTERVWRRLVTLPLYPDLAKEDIERIVEAAQSFPTA
jgi:perosamine synthetase